MDKTLSAYFLCAGYGQRLRPLTDRIPKPAIPFLGRTALEINFRKVEPLQPNRLICNTHHLPRVMEKPARKLGMDVLYEKEILGTGGCLWNAKHILETTDRFLVHNGDLIHTIDLKDLLHRHVSSGQIATLAGIFRPAHNTLSVGGRGELMGVHGFEAYAPTEAETVRLTFAGIAIYEKAFLNFVKSGVEDIKPYWTAALRAGHSIGVIDYSRDAAWYDFGTPQGLWDAAKFYMEQNQEFSYRYAPAVSNGQPYVANEAELERLPEGLRNVLVYEKPVHAISLNTKDCIVGHDLQWKIKP